MIIYVFKYCVIVNYADETNEDLVKSAPEGRQLVSKSRKIIMADVNFVSNMTKSAFTN